MKSVNPLAPRGLIGLGGLYALLAASSAQAQLLSFTLSDPEQDVAIGETTILQGRIRNDSGLTLDATDFQFNFFGFAPGVLEIEQLLGLNAFSLNSGAETPLIDLFSARLTTNAIVGQTYTVDALLQDVSGNESLPVQARFTAITAAVPEPAPVLYLTAALTVSVLLHRRGRKRRL
jgi:hypothetical protein